MYIHYPDKAIINDLNVKLKDINALPCHHRDYDAVIYQLGNNIEFHKKIYELAWDYPGIIVLHDFNIHNFLKGSFADEKNKPYYREALKASADKIGVDINDDTDLRSLEIDIEKYPLPEAIVKRSKATIVNNCWVKARLNDYSYVYLMPHGAEIDTSDLPFDVKQLLINKHNIKDEYIIGIFGFANRNKRIDVVLNAVAKLYHQGYPVKLLIVGEIDTGTYDVSDICSTLSLPQDIIIITGFVSDAEFLDYLKFCDIYVGLRGPSMGESSGPLYKALGVGKPCIISNYCQFKEVPDDICFKVDHGKAEVAQLTAFISMLMRMPTLRRQLRENALRYIENYYTYDLVAKSYYQIINKLVKINDLSEYAV